MKKTQDQLNVKINNSKIIYLKYIFINNHLFNEIILYNKY